ncbi:hypothetical protein [Nonomuraea sp. NPDC003214]
MASRRGAIVVLAILAAGCAAGAGHGASSPRAAVDAYIAGLNAADSAALARLAPPGNDARGDIARRLAAHGGQEIRLTSADLADDISPDVVNARLAGRGARGAYRERLTVTRCEESWCVVLGQAPSSRPTSDTSRYS